MKKAYTGLSYLNSLYSKASLKKQEQSFKGFFYKGLVKLPVFSAIFFSVGFSLCFAEPAAATAESDSSFDYKEELIVPQDKKTIQRKSISNLQEQLNAEQQKIEEGHKQYSIPTGTHPDSTTENTDISLKRDNENLNPDKEDSVRNEAEDLQQNKDENISLKSEDVNLKESKDENVSLKSEDVNLKETKDENINLKREEANAKESKDENINLKREEENQKSEKEDTSSVKSEAESSKTTKDEGTSGAAPDGKKEFNIEDELASLSTENDKGKKEEAKKEGKAKKEEGKPKGEPSQKDDKKKGKADKDKKKDDAKSPADDSKKNSGKKKLPKCKDLKSKGKMPKLAIAFDGSGSMMLPYGGTTRLNAAKAAGVDLVNSIDKNVEIGFVEINGCPASKNHGFFPPSQRAGLTSTMNRVYPNERDNKTPLVHGLNTLSKMLDGVNTDDVGILISDGVDTCGITHSVDLCSLARKLHQRKPRLKVHVILISDEVESAKCIANITGGKVYKPRDANQIRVSLKQAGSDLKKVCED